MIQITRWIAAVCVACSMMVLVVAAQAQKPITPAEAKALKNPVPADAASLQLGGGLFVKYCSSCHGVEGKGNGPHAPEGAHPANLTDDKWDHGSTDGEIFATIHNGVGPKYDMDAWEGRIKDVEVWNIINYIRSLGPKKP